jgi:hypothetical protein
MKRLIRNDYLARFFVLLVFVGSGATAAELRMKSFVSRAWLDRSDIQARLQEQGPLTGDAEIRFMTGMNRERFSVTWHHSMQWTGGDDVAFARRFDFPGGGDGLRTRSDGDDERLLDLSATLDSGDRHTLRHQVERLNATWRGEQWSLTLGREAQSLGGGILFHPLDFLSPFAPTTVDRDYKPGEDLVYLHRQFDGGGDIGFLAAGRRDTDHDVSARASSFAVRGRTQIGATEVEGVIAEHRDDLQTGLGLRIPVGGALLRTDVVAAKPDSQATRFSVVINADWSFPVDDKLVYAFVEYYHNGFGVKRLDARVPLPPALAARLMRGEVYTLMRDYAGIGGSVQWHPLMTQSLSLVGNLHDGSMFLQTAFRFDLSDSQELEAGCLLLVGDAGEEFGGKALGVDAAGRMITTGTGTRAYVRWTWFPRFARLNQN